VPTTVLSSRRVIGAIRHPLPRDVEWIDDVLDDWCCTMRWDLNGHTPSLSSLVSRLSTARSTMGGAFPNPIPSAGARGTRHQG
jgi:hypothetical protein